MNTNWWIEKTNAGYGVMKSYPPIRKNNVIRPKAECIDAIEHAELVQLREDFIKRFGYDPEPWADRPLTDIFIDRMIRIGMDPWSTVRFGKPVPLSKENDPGS